MSRMIERPEDYEVVEYIIEHTEVIPTYEEYERYDAEIGEDGLPMVNSGDCPMNQILREYLGFEWGYLELYDHPGKVEHLLTVLTCISHHRARRCLHPRGCGQRDAGDEVRSDRPHRTDGGGVRSLSDPELVHSFLSKVRSHGALRAHADRTTLFRRIR